MMSFRGRAGWAKVASLGGKLTALVCHLTNKVNKTEANYKHFQQKIGQQIFTQQIFDNVMTWGNVEIIITKPHKS